MIKSVIVTACGKLILEEQVKAIYHEDDKVEIKGSTVNKTIYEISGMGPIENILFDKVR